MKNIKKLSLILFAFILSIMCVAFSASATDSESGIIEGTKENITYKIYQDLDLMIISGEGKIPDHMFGSSNWCTICSGKEYDGSFDDGPEDVETDLDFAVAKVKTIIIEEGITEIGHKAFYFKLSYGKCLQTVILPQSLEKIGAYAFNYNDKLQNINFPESLKEIEVGAFQRTGLTNVCVPESVETLGKGVFNYCESLKSITFTNAVCSIHNCQALTSVTYPLDYEEVPQVRSCTNLKKIITPTTSSSNSIKITETLTSGENFYNCKSLEKITLSDEALDKLDINYLLITKKLPSKLNNVTGLSCKNSKLSWSAVSNAGCYQVYYYNGSKWQCIYTGTKTTCAAEKYGKYRVRAVCTDGSKYVYSKYTTFEVKELYCSGLKTKLSGTSVTLSWNKSSNATGYQVYYSTTSSTSGFKKLSNTSGTSYTAKNLKKGTTYYFKVRAYRKDANGYYQYSTFTSAKKVKIK